MVEANNNSTYSNPQRETLIRYLAAGVFLFLL